jgi:hydrogenase nickel incorporation protein HypB
VTVVNLMSARAPARRRCSSRLVASARPGIRVGVLEGDVKGTFDADRIAAKHVPVTQINTDPSFGGECHLDANMVRSALPSLPLADIDLLVIENVGNLVCPAEFRSASTRA